MGLEIDPEAIGELVFVQRQDLIFRRTEGGREGVVARLNKQRVLLVLRPAPAEREPKAIAGIDIGLSVGRDAFYVLGKVEISRILAQPHGKQAVALRPRRWRHQRVAEARAKLELLVDPVILLEVIEPGYEIERSAKQTTFGGDDLQFVVVALAAVCSVTGEDIDRREADVAIVLEVVPVTIGVDQPERKLAHIERRVAHHTPVLVVETRFLELVQRPVKQGSIWQHTAKARLKKCKLCWRDRRRIEVIVRQPVACDLRVVSADSPVERTELRIQADPPGGSFRAAQLLAIEAIGPIAAEVLIEPGRTDRDILAKRRINEAIHTIAITITNFTAHHAGKLVSWSAGAQRQCASAGIAAKQRALRSAQKFDAFDIEEACNDRT